MAAWHIRIQAIPGFQTLDMFVQIRTVLMGVLAGAILQTISSQLMRCCGQATCTAIIYREKPKVGLEQWF